MHSKNNLVIKWLYKLNGNKYKKVLSMCIIYTLYYYSVDLKDLN